MFQIFRSECSSTSSADIHPRSHSHSFFQPNTEYEIPQLLLLSDMVSAIKTQGILPDLSNTIVIGVQHILETTVTLFDALNSLGIEYSNMYFSGKCYSTSLEIAEQVHKRGIHLMPTNKPEEMGEYEKYCRKGITAMWEFFLERIRLREAAGKVIDRIIVLDEGGRCLENMPPIVTLSYKIAAIEQTRAGLYSESMNELLFPLIEVASCAVKKILEPPLIIEAIIARTKKLLMELQPKSTDIFGVIGNGAIGYALCQYLLSQGYGVVVYDKSEDAFKNILHQKFFRVRNVEGVLSNANIVFGCTGRDVTENIDILSVVKKDMIFISCTSEDKEFRSLLRTIAKYNVVSFDTLSDITCKTNNGSKIIIFQGGYPANFDRKPWNVPATDIEVTQGLLLGSCIQAILSATKPVGDGQTINHGSRQSLNPFLQSYVALHWLPRQSAGRYSENYFAAFQDVSWIQKNSGGDYEENSDLEKCFMQEPPKPQIIKIRSNL